MERLEAFKNFMRSGIQVVLDRIQNDIHNDLEGSDYLCSHIDRLINVLVHNLNKGNPVNFSGTLEIEVAQLL